MVKRNLRYDEAYLAYLLEVVRKAHEYGITVFIDPHQDGVFVSVRVCVCMCHRVTRDGAPAKKIRVTRPAMPLHTHTRARTTHAQYPHTQPHT